MDLRFRQLFQIQSIWTLPPEDGNFSVRLRLIKTYVTKHYRQALQIDRQVSLSRQKRGERNLWQRRFWEHLIRDERDFAVHCDYIHLNLVSYGICKTPQKWQIGMVRSQEGVAWVLGMIRRNALYESDRTLVVVQHD